jgi:FMN phosphatase YigB (HAD superfamily)
VRIDETLAGQMFAASKTVTFDFWDTIVVRFRPAEASKRLASMRLAWEIWKQLRPATIPSAKKLHERRIIIEKEIYDVKGETAIRDVLRILARESGIWQVDGDFIDSLVRQEVDDEGTYSTVPEPIKELLSGINNKCTVISDHYLSAPDLEAIANRHGVNQHFNKYLVSSDVGKTKRGSGELFTLFIPNPESEWLHVGDNLESDYINANKAGAKPVLVERKSYSSWNEHDIVLESLAEELPKHLGLAGVDVHNAQVAILAFGLCSFAIQRAIEEGKNRVMYLSREGELLAKVHPIAARFGINLAGVEILGGHLPVSRASTVFPATSDRISKTLNKLARQYSVMNGVDLSSSLGLSSELKAKVIEQVGYTELLPTKEIWSLLSGSLRKEIRTELEEKQKLLREYLDQENIHPSNTILADVGWRGTIQDSLSLITESEFTGCYLGLFDSLEFLGQFDKKSGLAFDHPNGNRPPKNLDFLGHIERSMSFSSLQSSGFQKSTNGAISPTFIDKKDGASVAREGSFDRVVSLAESVGNAMFSSGFFGRESGDFVQAVMSQMTFEPNEFTSATWFDELHEEGFGTVTAIEKVVGDERESETSIFQNSILLSTPQRTGIWPEGTHSWHKDKSKIERKP